MATSVLDMSMSLDGFVAGPNEGPENGLGDGGERLHDWFFGRGGETAANGVPGRPDGVDGEMMDAVLATGAVVSGRTTFERAGGWGGDHHDGVPIFILSRGEPMAEAADWPLVTYLADVAEAMSRARDAAGEREILVHGVTGARLALAAGVLDEVQIHLVPILLGGGRRLFEDVPAEQVDLEPVRVVEGPEVTHLRYRVRPTVPASRPLREPPDLYERQAATLLASWRAYATHSAGAGLVEGDGFAAAVFPSEPERRVYNNALLARGLDPGRVQTAIAAAASAYREAGIDRYAVWAHESEPGQLAELEARDYRLDTSTRAMAMPLADLPPPDPRFEATEIDWPTYTAELEGLPGLLAGATAAEFHLRAARHDGRLAGAMIAHDHEGDRGIYNLGTVAPARRRGIGTALTLTQLHDARDRGLTTASLQSTAVAERLYAALGFRDLGRYLEFVPGPKDA